MSAFFNSAVAILFAVGLGGAAFAAEVEPQGSDQLKEGVTLQNSGIEGLHGIRQLKGADLATVGVDIASGKGFAIMRENPTGSGLTADDHGFQIAGQPITSLIGISPATAGGSPSANVPSGIPGGIVPGLDSVPILGLPIINGFTNTH